MKSCSCTWSKTCTSATIVPAQVSTTLETRHAPFCLDVKVILDPWRVEVMEFVKHITHRDLFPLTRHSGGWVASVGEIGVRSASREKIEGGHSDRAPLASICEGKEKRQIPKGLLNYRTPNTLFFSPTKDPTKRIDSNTYQQRSSVNQQHTAYGMYVRQ